MTGERYRFNKFTVDKSWKEKFSDDAMDFLKTSKDWLYNKLNSIINNPDGKPMEWIVVIDTGEVDQEEGSTDKKSLSVKSVLVSSDFDWYKGYDNMLFQVNNLKQGAVANMQSENAALQEVACAVVKGAGAKYDPTILFPFTKECWAEKKNDKEEVEEKSKRSIWGNKKK